MEYETRTTRVTVAPKGEPIFSEQVTHIEIDDEAAGEFIVIKQQRGQPDPDLVEAILVDREEWPILRKEIDKMIKTLR